MDEKFNNLNELFNEYYELVKENPTCLKPYATFKTYLVDKDNCCDNNFKCIDRPKRIKELVNNIENENDNEKRLKAILELFSHGGKFYVGYGNEVKEYEFKQRILHSAINRARLPVFLKGSYEKENKIVLNREKVLEFGEAIVEYIKFFEDFEDEDIILNHSLKGEDKENEIGKQEINKFKNLLKNNIDSLINEILFWFYYEKDKFPILNKRTKNSKIILKNSFQNENIPSKMDKFITFCLNNITSSIKTEDYLITKNLMLDQLFYSIDEMKNTSKIEQEYKKNKEDKIYKFYLKLWNTIKDAKKIATGKENEFKTLLKKSKNIIFYGSPGTGKTWETENNIKSILKEYENEKITENRFLKIVFHPNYTYEDFLEGYKPTKDGENIILDLKKGKFLEFCDTARKYEQEYEESSKNEKFKNAFFVLVDEINRANLSSVFGEVMYAIEEDKRGEEVTLQYSNEKFSIPKNIYFIGTMNDIDRSIDTFDLALRRRFMWVKKSCDYEVIYEELKEFENIGEIGDEPESGYLRACYELNKSIIKKLGDGFELGHSYFLKISKFINGNEIKNKSLKELFDYHIAPLIREYLRTEYNEDEIDKHLKEMKNIFSIKDKSDKDNSNDQNSW